MFAAAWSGSEFVIVGQFGLNQHSVDGINWTSEDNTIEGTFIGDLNGVTWNGNRFIAVGPGGRIITTL